MYEKKLNGSLRFDTKTEADIINIIDRQAGSKRLTEFICSTIRYAMAHSKDFDNEYEYDLDKERTKFFKGYKKTLEELTVDYCKDQKELREKYDIIEDELNKLHILGESGKLFGFEKRVELLQLESLLVKHESKRIQQRIWRGYRPQITIEEENDIQKGLERRAEEIMIYLIEHYSKELNELRMGMSQVQVVQTTVTQAVPEAPAMQAVPVAVQPQEVSEATTMPGIQVADEDYNDFIKMSGIEF